MNMSQEMFVSQDNSSRRPPPRRRRQVIDDDDDDADAAVNTADDDQPMDDNSGNEEEVEEDEEEAADEELASAAEDNEEVEEEEEDVITEQLKTAIKAKKPLLNTKVTDEEIDKQRATLADIERQIKEADKCESIDQMVELLNKVIQRLNKEFICTGPTVNMSLDAAIMKLAARLLYEATKRLQTDTKRFNVMEFAGKCVRALDPTDWATTATDGSGSRRRGSNDDNDDSIVRRTIGFDTSDWVEFGRKYCPNIQSIVPPMNYIFGAFESEPPAERPVKQRQKRQKTVLSEQTQATQLVTENMNDDGTPEEVELIMETIKKLESRNKNFDSLPYIQVVTNPKSMAETVENIFHSAFLVKDGLVRLRAADDGLPGVQSIDNSGLDVQSGLPEQGIQSVFTFTMKDWVKWCEKFEIKKPAIRHKKKDNNNNKKSQKTSDNNN